MFENYHEWSDDRIKEKYQEILDWVSERMVERAYTTNCYKCETCGKVEKYLYVDSGVTPFMISCKNCEGMAQSSGNIMGHIPATMEWFRPELEEILELKNNCDERSNSLLSHYLNGGLESRKRFSGGRMIIIGRGISKTQELVKMLSDMAAYDIPIITLDSAGPLPASLVQTTPITEPPKPVKIPAKNIPPAPKSRQQRRKEERENRKKKRR